MHPDELVREVTEALTAVGGHHDVPFEVTRAETDGVRIRLDVTLHYLRARPVCCPEPGCYIRFIGAGRFDVPKTLECRLELPVTPRVSMTVHMLHEDGYRYAPNGGPGWPGVDSTFELGEEHFADDLAG